MSLNLFESFPGFGNDRDGGEELRMCVCLEDSDYLFVGAELGGNQAERDVDAALCLLMLLQMPC